MAEWDVGCDARFDYETRVESERERPKEPRVSLSYDSGAPRLPRLKVGAWIGQNFMDSHSRFGMRCYVKSLQIQNN